MRAAAELELQRLTGGVPTRAEAVRLLTDAARAYFDRRQPVEGVVDGKVELWRWDEPQRRCVARSVTPEEAARTLAARRASDAYAIAPDDPQVRLLYLATLLEAAAYRKGLDRPWDEKDPALAEAKRFGVKTLEAVLEYAMAHGHPAAAAAAARLLGEIGTAGELLGRRQRQRQPRRLIEAVQSPDRRLRMAAAEAIVRLQPARPFAGSSYVLGRAGVFRGQPRRPRRAGRLPQSRRGPRTGRNARGGGLPGANCFNGKELLSQAARSPDYELALIDVTIDRPHGRHALAAVAARPADGLAAGGADRAGRLFRAGPAPRPVRSPGQGLRPAARRPGLSLATRSIGLDRAAGVRRFRGPAAAGRPRRSTCWPS